MSGVALSHSSFSGDTIASLRKSWGPVLELWEGYATDEEIRFKGSSGGAATAIALHCLEWGIASGVLHVGTAMTDPLRNVPIFSTTKAQLIAATGSRYAPASPCEKFDWIENSDSACVFVGKPCDMAAVGKAAELRPALREKIRLTIAFFCAGTPSTYGTLEMFKQMGIDDPASATSLRYRGRGWLGMTTVTFRTPEGGKKRKELTYEQSWGEILQKYRQWRCYICPDHIGEFSDIAVADAWHRPVLENQPGRSVIIARTIRGKEILEQAIHDGFIEAEAVSSEILPLCRPGQAAYQGRLWARVQTLKAMRVPNPDYRRFDLFRVWISELSI